MHMLIFKLHILNVKLKYMNDKTLTGLTINSTKIARIKRGIEIETKSNSSPGGGVLSFVPTR